MPIVIEKDMILNIDQVKVINRRSEDFKINVKNFNLIFIKKILVSLFKRSCLKNQKSKIMFLFYKIR